MSSKSLLKSVALAALTLLVSQPVWSSVLTDSFYSIFTVLGTPSPAPPVVNTVTILLDSNVILTTTPTNASPDIAAANAFFYTVGAGPKIALIKDVNPFGRTATEDALKRAKVPYTIYSSVAFGQLNLDQVSVLILSSNQPQSYYDNIGKRAEALTTWQTTFPRTLLFFASDSFAFYTTGNWFFSLPGGVKDIPNVQEFSYNTFVRPSDPVVQGVASIRSGDSVIGAGVFSVPSDRAASAVVATGSGGQPTILDYCFGPVKSRVIATTDLLEYYYHLPADYGVNPLPDTLMDNFIKAATEKPGC